MYFMAFPCSVTTSIVDDVKEMRDVILDMIRIRFYYFPKQHD
jgi:hypothetical protein